MYYVYNSSMCIHLDSVLILNTVVINKKKYTVVIQLNLYIPDTFGTQ